MNLFECSQPHNKCTINQHQIVAAKVEIIPYPNMLLYYPITIGVVVLRHIQGSQLLISEADCTRQSHCIMQL